MNLHQMISRSKARLLTVLSTVVALLSLASLPAHAQVALDGRWIRVNHKLCEIVGYTEEELDGSWQPYGPVGCERCSGSGYKGRVGIYQVMPISDEIQRIILTNGNAMQIAEQAKRENIRDLRRSGLLKVMQGLTSIEEVLGVTNE